MTSLWLWPVIFFLMPAQASFMRPNAGGACSPTGTAFQPHVTIVCQGVNPQVLELLNTVLDTADLDLHSKICQAEAWVRTYHALVQRLAEGGRDHVLIHEAHALVQAGKLAEAGALLDRVLASSDDARPERVAAYSFSRADIFALQFQLREALPHYAAASRSHASHPQYTYRYAAVLQQQRRYTEAEPLYRTTLNALRPLASADPTTYVPMVARPLDSLASVYHSETRRLSAAEAAYHEALTLHRQRVQTNPTAVLPDVATTLDNLAVLALAQSRLQHAAEWIREAVTIRRTLWQHDPATYGDVLAQSLEIEVVRLDQAHLLFLTTGRFLAPDGSPFGIHGLTPDRAYEDDDAGSLMAPCADTKPIEP